MNLPSQLAVLALHQLLGERADSVLEFLDDRFSDRGRRVTGALQTANERAWRCLEVALAGETWWDRCKGLIGPREETAFRAQVQAFLHAAPPPGLGADGEEFRRRCLAELRAARQARHIPGDEPGPNELAEHARAFNRYASPARHADGELRAVGDLVEGLRQAGYPRLGEYVGLRPTGGPPLLVIAVRFFFRRAVEEDAKLAAGLTFDHVQGLGNELESGLRGLHDALKQSGGRLEQMLEGAQALLADTHEDVRAMRAELERQGKQIHDLYQALLRALEQQRLAPASSPPAPAEPAGTETGGLEVVRQLVDRCAALPAERKQQLPELFQTIGRLRETAASYEVNRRTYLRLTGKAPLSPLFAPPAEAVPLPQGPTPSPRPALRRIAGPLIGAAFAPPPDEPAAEEQPAPPLPPRKGARGLSPLFQPPEA